MQKQITRPAVHTERMQGAKAQSKSPVNPSRVGTPAVKQAVPVQQGNALGEMDRLFGMWGSL